MAMEKEEKIEVKTLNQMLAERFDVVDKTVSRALHGKTSGPNASRMRWAYRKVEEFIKTV